MAIVPVVRERQVSRRPAHQQYFSVRVNPDAFGANIGRALTGLGDTVSSVGARIDAEKAATAARDADNQFDDWLRVRLHDEESGYLNQQGDIAFSTRAAVEQEIEQKRKEFGGGLTGKAAEAYQRASENRKQSAYSSVIKHSSQQFRAYSDKTQEVRFDNLRRSAVDAVDDPRVRREAFDAAVEEYRVWGESHGWSQELISAAIEQWQSSTHAAIIGNMAVAKGPRAAWRYFNANKGAMTQPDKDTLKQGPLGKAAQQATIQSTLGEWADMGAVDDSRSSLDKLNDPAETSIGGVPDPASGEVEGKGQERLGAGGKQSSVTTPYMKTPAAAKAFLATRTNKAQAAIDGLKDGFAQDLGNLIAQADVELGEGLAIYSGYRSPEHQAKLFKSAVSRYGSVAAARKWVAPPGHSRHNSGVASDLMYRGQRLDKAPAAVREWVHANASAFGLRFRMSWEPWHIEPEDPSTAGNASGGGRLRAPKVSPPPELPQGFVSLAQATGIPPETDDFFRQTLGQNISGKGDFLGNYEPGFGYVVEQIGDEQPSDWSSAAAQTRVYEKIAEIEDPFLRSQYAAEWAKMVKTRGDLRKLAQDEASEEGWRMTSNGQFDQIPFELRQQMGVSAYQQLRNYNDKENKGETDWVVYHDLHQMAVDDPERFKQEDLRDLRVHLGDKFDELVKLQTSVKSGDDTDLTKKLSALKNLYGNRLRGLGILDTPANMNDKEHTRLANFERILLERVNAIETATGKPLTSEEINRVIDDLLVPIVLKRDFARDPRGFVFDIPALAEDEDVIELDVNYDDIPADVRADVSGSLKGRLGRAPTKDEVVEAYEAFLADRGNLNFD